MIEVPTQMLDTLSAQDADQWFRSRLQEALRTLAKHARGYYHAMGREGEVEAFLPFAEAVEAADRLQVEQQAYFRARRVREAEEKAAALRRAQRAREAEAAARRAARPPVRRSGADVGVRTCGADLSGLPGDTETREQRILNDARRARPTSTVHIDTGNLTRRMPVKDNKRPR